MSRPALAAAEGECDDGFLMLIRPLFGGPLDLVGDVHGEFEALKALIRKLGYDEHGEHPQHRRLVFVGDLCDRGPDSPSVLRLVRTLVERGLAQCVAGNHELNVLRAEHKDGNHWFHGEESPEQRRDFGPCALADEATREEARQFFANLPLALERPDLRVVHAAWHPESVDRCRRMQGSVLEAYQVFDDEAERSEDGRRIRKAHAAAEATYKERLRDKAAGVPGYIPEIAEYDEHCQMSNPVRVLSSGQERRIAAGSERSFFAGGKWRFVQRVDWWRAYADPVPVVFGHYWRWWHAEAGERLGEARGGEGFDDGLPGPGLATAARAICIDFSAGARFKERLAGARPPLQTRLAALRWDERRLICDGDDPPPP